NAVPNDPLYGQQWHLPIIQAPQAWDTANGSPNVVVAVIDTGIDLTHPDLVNVIWSNPNESSDGADNDGNGLVDDVHGWNFLGNNADLTDSTGHGTHVAGLIGAEKNNSVGVAGVASGVKIMPLVVGDTAPASAVVSAIYYAATHGANIINMSFGGHETFNGARAAIDYAVARGVLLVASANNWSSEEYNYPAVYQDVLAVAATDPNDRRASLSNYGSWVDIAAPGQAVFSTFPPSSYMAVSGTSQAAPIVAGVAALVKSVHPGWTAEQVRAQLLASADDLDALNPDYVGLLGAGRVNAARAVGAVIATPRPFLAGVTSSEIAGDGDQQLSAGDTASVSVSWRFTGNASSAAASLTSSDPYVTVSSGSVTLTAPRADRTQTARFTINIAANAPADHIASINASINAGGASVSAPIQLSVAPSYRRLKLPFAYHQVLLPHPSGRQLFVADDSPLDGPRHRVYAAFRNADGSFTQESTISDTSNNARKPTAYVDANGDVHVAFYQSVQSREFAAFPGYSKFTAATGQWSSTTITSGSQMWARLDQGTAGSAQPIAITRSPTGELLLAWGQLEALILAKQVGDTWVEQQTFPYPGGEDVTFPQLDLKFITVDNHLMLFVHPIPTRATLTGPPPDFTRKLQVLDYDGTSWSAPVELDGGSETERAQLPFLYSGEVRRFYEPIGSTTVSLASLSGTVWNPLQTVQDIDSVDMHSGFFGLQECDTCFVTFLSRPVEATGGSRRELWDHGVAHLLVGETLRRAEYPVITDDAGTLYVFNQERWLHREHELWFDFPDKTNLYTQAPLAPAALPTVPVVLDDGDITNDNRYLHARWSSSHPSGIASYRVAWGTAPGLADILPWTETILTENIFDLGEQRLLPGQTVYLSVEAHSNAVLSSALGASDGITLSNL
ncbi:MAG TPA: S8 family peptidase, partial [Polyangiaceae bacterium]|nr:S8 family peptidase [Polyangiaceae bacterium]